MHTAGPDARSALTRVADAQRRQLWSWLRWRGYPTQAGQQRRETRTDCCEGRKPLPGKQTLFIHGADRLQVEGVHDVVHLGNLIVCRFVFASLCRRVATYRHKKL